MLQRLMRWGVFALIAGVLTFMAPEAAAKKKDGGAKQPKMDRLSGTVHQVDKANSTIEIRKGTVHRTIVYTPDTKWTASNKPGTMADLKDGSRIVAVGKFDEKTRLVASRIEVSRK